MRFFRKKPKYRIHGHYPCWHLDILDTGELGVNRLNREYWSSPSMLSEEAEKHHHEYLRNLSDNWQRLHESEASFVERFDLSDFCNGLLSELPSSGINYALRKERAAHVSNENGESHEISPVAYECLRTGSIFPR